MDKEKLLRLAKNYAKKTRRLIPRSDNRVGEFGPLGHVQDSHWRRDDDPPNPDYLYFQQLAQRSRSGAIRRTVYDVNEKTDLGYKKPTEDAATNEAFWKQAISTFNEEYNSPDSSPWDKKKLDTGLREQLTAETRWQKKTHKDRKPFLVLEQAEASAKNAVRFRVGNCRECADLAFVMFAEYKEPDLPKDEEERPMVELVGCLSGGDHSFLVINRNCSRNIQDEVKDNWMPAPATIICDPWWFHEGDAFFPANARKDTMEALLLDHIKKYGLNVLLQRRLGCGHSTRFTEKHPNINFAENSDDVIQNAFRY
jgi:hypothetical protein